MRINNRFSKKKNMNLSHRGVLGDEGRRERQVCVSGRCLGCWVLGVVKKHQRGCEILSGMRLCSTGTYKTQVPLLKGFRSRTSRRKSQNSRWKNKGTMTRKEDAAAKKALPLFRVLGIALVVDQIGKGAQMVLRYPVGFEEQQQVVVTDGDEDDDDQNDLRDYELFFQMSPRVMAKLFRPKKSLCGQPMTLSVGGTVFCCRAVLLEHNDEVDTSANSVTSLSSSITNNNNESKLVLFSVIVALTPSEPTKSIPISGWFDGDEEKRGTTTTNYQNESTNNNGNRAASSSARSIRRVHLSLARLCRALEREERRCRFVSAQSNHFFRIRSESNKEWEGRMAMAGQNSTTNNNNNKGGGGGDLTSAPSNTTGGVGGSSPKGVVGGNTPTATPTVSTTDMSHRGSRHTRSLTATSLTTSSTIASLSVTAAGGGGGGGGGGGDGTDQHPNMTSDSLLLDKSQLHLHIMEQEKEQEILERILASSPPAEHSKDHFGNLAREIIQVFHSLSRDDPRHKYPTTHTAGRLSGREAVVYVNGHIAVPIESAIFEGDGTTTSLGVLDRRAMVRSYHTLLFPTLSPLELVDTLQLAASSPQQQSMQQLLMMINPARSLNEIANDSNVSLSAVLDMALQLIQQGVCMASPVISRSTRLACAHNAIAAMQDLALDFGQTFALGPGGGLFVVVSQLTFHNWTLGESLASISRSDSERASFLRSQIQHLLHSQQQQQSTPHHQLSRRSLLSSSADDVSQHHLKSYSELLPSDSGMTARHHADELEEVLCSMAIWLVSHRVLVRLEEYLVALASGSSSLELHLVFTDSAEEKRPASNTYLPSYFGTIPDSVVDENLFKELKDAECLDGTKSLTACSWKLGIESHRLRSWAVRHELVRIVERIPAPGDDWGFVE